MKLSATLAAAAVAGTLLVSATAANAAALVTESYDYSGGDAAILHVTNTGHSAFTNITISGGYAGGFTDYGSLAAGATVDYYLGDNENDFPGSQGTAHVTIDGVTRSFTDVLGDPDFVVGNTPLGSMVPEPASWAMLISGFGILGGAMRVARRKAVAA